MPETSSCWDVILNGVKNLELQPFDDFQDGEVIFYLDLRSFVEFILSYAEGTRKTCHTATLYRKVRANILLPAHQGGRDLFRSLLWALAGVSHGIPYPRPMKGILVAITVINCTLASSGRLAM